MLANFNQTQLLELAIAAIEFVVMLWFAEEVKQEAVKFFRFAVNKLNDRFHTPFLNHLAEQNKDSCECPQEDE